MHEKYGALDHTLYPHVFGLLLRLRANYIWTAMWQPRAFSADDPLNPNPAAKYGIAAGMRVPGDVIPLWCDDNWSNIRRLPSPEEMSPCGGGGVYYHFDYVGNPPESPRW